MIVIKGASVASQPADRGITRKPLLADTNGKGPSMRFVHLTLAPGATLQFKMSLHSLGWMQMLGGNATFKAYYTDQMSEGISALLPPSFSATLTTDTGASLFYAEIPDLGRVDHEYKTRTPLFIVSDWMREPVFESEHDTRKRVALVSSKLSDTQAVKIEMVVYPPNSIAPECQHEAETFMYILAGSGTAIAGGEQQPVGQGDLVYFSARERHSLKAASNSEMRFIAFYTPAEFETVWTDSSKKSAWMSTGLDIEGRATEADERERLVYSFMFGSPWTR